MSDCYLSVRSHFGFENSTVGAVFMQMCRTINHLLQHRPVTFGNVQETADGFEARGFLNCGRVIYGMYRAILAPCLRVDQPKG